MYVIKIMKKKLKTKIVVPFIYSSFTYIYFLISSPRFVDVING